MFKRIPQKKSSLFLCFLLLVSSVLYAQETIYTPTTTKISKDTGTTAARTDLSTILDFTISPDQEEIEVQISSYVDNYTLTGWKATNPDCQTANNVCQEITIENLLITFILRAKLIKKENEKFLYTSIDANGEIKFKGTATKYWPFSEVYNFSVTRGYTISGGAGLIVYSSDISRVTSIDMNLPFGPDYPQLYKLRQGYNNIDTLSIRAALPRGWLFTYPYDLYQVYPTEVKHDQYTVKYFDKDDPTREIGGAAADGASRVMIQISGLENTVSINDVAITVSGANDGYLENDKQINNGIFTQTYHAPKDFVRENYVTDLTAGQRAIDLEIRVRNALITHNSLFLFKPPVVLIHGMFSSAEMWTKSGFMDYLYSNYGPRIYAVNYDSDTYFMNNVSAIKSQLHGSIKNARDYGYEFQIVVKKTDVISHSMGGNLTNLYIVSGMYNDNIHRLITIDTPHSGSNLANLIYNLYQESGPLSELLFDQIDVVGWWYLDKSISAGAVRDLQIGSKVMTDLIVALRNPATHNVPSAAIQGQGGKVGIIPNLPSVEINALFGFLFWWDSRILFGKFFGEPRPYPLSLDYHPSKVERVVYGEGDKQDETNSDYIVDLPSQTGGCAVVAAKVKVKDHINCSNNDDIRNQVLQWLNSSVDKFDQRGFNPAFMVPRFPPVETIQQAHARRISIQHHQNSLKIVFPTPDESFNPGDTLTVKVASEDSSVEVTCLAPSVFATDDTYPFELPIIIDKEYIGAMPIMAVSVDKNGKVQFDEIRVKIESPYAPLSIDVFPQAPVFLHEGTTSQLYVEAEYPDGIKRNITFLESTNYSSSHPSVALVTKSGVVNALSAGQSEITIENKGVSMRIVIIVEYTITGVTGDETLRIPKEFSLVQNYPNPFNPTTIIHYALPRSSFINLIIYDLLGREVRILVNQIQKAGEHSIIWDGNNAAGQRVPSGVYLYQLRASNKVQTKKMLLIK